MVVGTATMLNLIPSGVMPVVYLNQNDAGYDKQFLIYNDSQPYNVPEGVSVTIRGRKGDDYGITENATFTVGSNLITVRITEQMTAVAGEKNIFELIFVNADGLRVGTINMIFAVEGDALGDAVISESEISYAEHVMTELQSIHAEHIQIQQNKTNIANEVRNRVSAVAAEAAARQSADTALQGNITVEKNRATAAEESLLGKINAETNRAQTAENSLLGKIDTETATRQNATASLQSQIDNLVAPTGAAPSEAEVQNARIGVDGTTYASLGDALRMQTNDLLTQLKAANAANLLNLTAGYTATPYNVKFTVNADKSITATGTATGLALFNLYNQQNAFPSGIAPGGEYYIAYSGNKIRARVAIYESSGARDIVEVYSNTYFRVPLSATGCIISLAASSGDTVSETVRMKIYPAYTNAKLANNISFLTETVKDVKNNVWHKGLLTAAGAINTSSRGIYSDIITGCNSIYVNFDHIAYVFLYKGGFYMGKIAANGSLNRVSGDWKAFTGGVDIGTLIDQFGADSARITVTPQNTAQITEDGANDYGKINCDLTADIYIRGANGADDAVRDSVYLPNVLQNPLYKYYKAFNWVGVDTSGTAVTYGSPTYARCTAICQFDEPLYVAINHNDYQLGIYWVDENGAHGKTWSESWEVPAGVPVAIVIRRAEWSSNNESMEGETPWIYLFVRSLNDKPKDYFRAEIEDTIQKVKALNTEPSLCFTLSTDQHYMTVINWLQKYDSISDMCANMKAVGESVKFDFNVALGDIADFAPPYSDAVANRFGISDRTPSGLNSLFYHWMEYCMKKLYSVNPNMIYVAGNHDDNRYLRLNASAPGYDYTKEQMYSYYMSNAYKTTAGANPNNNLEYYFDLDNLGIRVIILDSNYYNNTESGWFYGFSHGTAEWLSDVLNASAGKQVLILSHMSPIYTHNGDNAEYTYFPEVAAAIQEWKDAGGDLIAVLYGHSHCDWSTDTPWRDIAFNCQKCHQLTTLFENMPGAVAPARTMGTAAEDSWNVVIIRPKSRKINIIRFGAGDDAEYDY